MRLPRLPLPLSLARAIPALLLLAACDSAASEPPLAPPPPPSLTPAVAREVVRALSTVTSVNIAAILQGTNTPDLATTAKHQLPHATTTDFFTDTVPCPASGNTIVRGRISFDSAGLSSFDYRDDFRGCGTVDADGDEWNFSAELPLHTFMRILTQTEPDAPWLEGFIIGVVRFERGTLEGRCSFAVQVSSVGDAVEFGGTVCGHPIAALRDVAVVAASRD